MDYELITVETEEGVGIVTLNRPEKLNAMNNQLNVELQDAVKQSNANDEIGCVVLTGAGKRAFSAGGDIHEQRENDLKFTQEELDARSAVRSRGSYEISACPKPIIGMMNGLAYGGGAVLSSSLDFRIGCEHSSFRFLAAAYGRINCTWTLPNQVGWPMAKELLFTGRVVEAEEAYRIGLLNHLVPGEELLDKAVEVAAGMAKNRVQSVANIKQMLLEHTGFSLEEQFRNENQARQGRFRGLSVEEGFKEFLDRKGRKPRVS